MPQDLPPRRLPDRVTTERLILDRIRPSDLADLVRYCNNEQAMTPVGGRQTEAEVREWIDFQLVHWEQHGLGRWVLRDRASGAFLGRGGLKRIAIEGRDEVEIGYGLLPEYWGQGLATEMTVEALRLAFEVLGCESVVAFTRPTNDRSRRVMQRVGMLYERDIVWTDLPHVLYRMQKESFVIGHLPLVTCERCK
jgi:ribosomal-protein-alanine N-acetyltransferase